MKNTNLAFGKKNYRLLLIGLGVLILGFILMSLDSEPHGFGVLGLWVGPLVVLAGFGIQFAAILTHDDVPELEGQAAKPAPRKSTSNTTAKRKPKPSNTAQQVQKKPTQMKKRKRKNR